MERLKAYVRRTVLRTAKEYGYPKKRRTKATTVNAFRDAISGTSTGWWSDLIDADSAFTLFKRYRADVREAIHAEMAESGALSSYAVPVQPHGHMITYGEMLRATEASSSLRLGIERYREGAAALLAIRFSVSYLARVVAQELGVGL